MKLGSTLQPNPEDVYAKVFPLDSNCHSGTKRRACTD